MIPTAGHSRMDGAVGWRAEREEQMGCRACLEHWPILYRPAVVDTCHCTFAKTQGAPHNTECEL